MRENVVPYVSSLVFAVSVVLMVAIYGIIRYFTTKKTAYQVATFTKYVHQINIKAKNN